MIDGGAPTGQLVPLQRLFIEGKRGRKEQVVFRDTQAMGRIQGWTVLSKLDTIKLNKPQMTSLFQDLYSDLILDHYRAPRNRGMLSNYTHDGVGCNPLCGDTIAIFARITEDGVLEALQWEGEGCALCLASASLLSDLLQVQPMTQVYDRLRAFHQLTQGQTLNVDQRTMVGNLVVFEKISVYPGRIQCVTLAGDTAQRVLTKAPL